MQLYLYFPQTWHTWIALNLHRLTAEFRGYHTILLTYAWFVAKATAVTEIGLLTYQSGIGNKIGLIIV